MRLYNDVALKLVEKLYLEGKSWEEIFEEIYSIDSSVFRNKYFCFALRHLMSYEFSLSEFEVEFVLKKIFPSYVVLVSKEMCRGA